MKILLLQNMLYVPTFGGANKANRLLLEGLGHKGHDCRVVAPAMGSHGARSHAQFLEELQIRNLKVLSQSPEACIFECNGVEIHAVFALERLQTYAINQARAFRPDHTLVSSQDPGQLLLAAALEGGSGQITYAVHSPWDLPFGPHSIFNSDKNTTMVQQMDGIITVSNYLKSYIQQWSGMDSTVIPFPVYGEGPFPDLTTKDKTHVTLINPSTIKGISIFESLARSFSQFQFAAVPTWATTEADKQTLLRLPNVELWEASDEIGVIFAKTKVLLVPSLWPEAFGLIVVEAMLRGIPVIASNSGGLPEAKLGIDYVIPIVPIEPKTDGFDERNVPLSMIPKQDMAQWQSALNKLLSDPQHYHQISRDSRAAALAFVANIAIEPFERFFENLSANKSIKTATYGSSNENFASEKSASSPTGNLSPEKRALLALRALKIKKKN